MWLLSGFLAQVRPLPGLPVGIPVASHPLFRVAGSPWEVSSFESTTLKCTQCPLTYLTLPRQLLSPGQREEGIQGRGQGGAPPGVNENPGGWEAQLVCTSSGDRSRGQRLDLGRYPARSTEGDLASAGGTICGGLGEV